MFVRLILASLLADFVFQPSSLVDWKRRRLGGLLVHVLVVFLLALLAGIDLWSLRYLVLVVTLAAMHLAIDWIKIVIDNRIRDGYWPLITFLGDQALHVGTIDAILVSFGYTPTSVIWYVLDFLLTDPRHLALGSVYVAAVFAGSIVVRLVVQPFEMKVTERPGLLRAGAYIGMIERLLLTSLVASDQYGAVGFVLAAKSIARHKQMEDPEFAEYFLIGTLTSSALAVVAGILVKAILR